ncbi:MAG: protein kinase [Rubripirellula sp.]
MSDLSQTELDRIAEEFSRAIRSGQSPTVDEFLERYPDPSGELLELLSSVALIEGLKGQIDSDESASNSTLNISQLDDYTIVREIGRGGMGVVFEAIHQSLGRRVAVKVLSGNLLGETKHLVRFRREARAAARLRHTNIVPVFGVGQSGDHHYYVMDLIEGMSLKDWVDELVGKRRHDLPTIDEAVINIGSDVTHPDHHLFDENDKELSDFREETRPTATDASDYFRWVARLGVTICDALHYAHARGVLHRDIKPANLLIDRKHDVWIADFGLAKLAEQQPVTMTGDVVGTPQYMPPESFDGHYDVKSEVYGAGLTLYELLALRPAIAGRNTGDTIRKATQGVSISPRKYNAAIPSDLETIIMKSLAHDPRARYVTAGELRDDLQRYLLDQPISARRTGYVERAVRWSRREPTVAALTFATFALLSALAVVSAFGYFTTQGALGKAEAATKSANQSLDLKTEALNTADQQRLRAEKNLQVALTAFDTIMRNITDRGIETDADFLGEVTDTTAADVSPEDAELLQTLLGFFDELATNNSEDLLAESAVAAQRAGDIYVSLGKLSQADKAYSDALGRYTSLSESESDNLSFIIARAQIMNELAVISSLRGNLARAHQLFQPTIQLLQASDAAMAAPEGQFQYAKASRLFASISSRSGLDGFDQSQQGPRARRPITVALKKRAAQDFDAISSAVDVLESLIESYPNELRYRAELARVFRDKAKVAARSNRNREAEGAVRESIDLFEELLAANPESNALRYELSMTLLSTEAFGFNQRLRAVRADELSNQLLKSSPDLPRYRALKALSLEQLASHKSHRGELQLAEKHLLEAARVYTALIATSPELSLYETQRAQVLESIADIKIEQEDTQAAIVFLDRAIRLLQPRMLRTNPSPVSRIQLQRMRQKLKQLE